MRDNEEQTDRPGRRSKRFFIGLDWMFVFKVTEVQPLMGLTGVRQMAASSDPPPVIPVPESLAAQTS